MGVRACVHHVQDFQRTESETGWSSIVQTNRAKQEALRNSIGERQHLSDGIEDIGSLALSIVYTLITAVNVILSLVDITFL